MNFNAPTIPNPPRADAAPPPHHAGSARAELTPWQKKRFHWNQEKLRRVGERLVQGYTTVAACSEEGIGVTTFAHLQARFRKHGLDGLIPRKPKGRPPQIPVELYTPALMSELQRLAVKLGGSRAACRVFAANPDCPESLRHYVSKHDRIPDLLRRLIGYRRCSTTIRRAGNFFYIERLGPNQQAAA